MFSRKCVIYPSRRRLNVSREENHQPLSKMHIRQITKIGNQEEKKEPERKPDTHTRTLESPRGEAITIFF